LKARWEVAPWFSFALRSLVRGVSQDSSPGREGTARRVECGFWVLLEVFRHAAVEPLLRGAA